MVEVSQTALRARGRGIQELVIAKARERERVAQEQARQTQIRRQQEAIAAQEEQRRITTPPGTFEIFVIDRGGGRTPKNLSVVGRIPGGTEFGQLPGGKFSTREAALKALRKLRREFADSDTPVGVRSTPSIATARAKPRISPGGPEIIGPAPKGKPTTRTEKEQLEIQQQAATLALANIEAGTSFASPEAIARLKAQEKTQKQFVEERILKQLAEGTTLTQFKTFEKIKKEPIKILFTEKAFVRAKEVFKPIGDKDAIRPDRRDIVRVSDGVLPSKLEIFEEKTRVQEERERKFREAKGFERIETVAGFLTLGIEKRGDVLGVIPIEERGFIGRRAQKLIGAIMAAPIALGGLVGEVLEKGKLFIEAAEVPEIGKKAVLKEFVKDAPQRLKEEFKKLSPEEKLDIVIFASVAPFLGGGPVRRFLGKKVTRGKVIEELTPIEKAKLERFELSVKELKNVRVDPNRINLNEVERLTPTAAKALDRIIIRNKDNLVVGGSVAQRTQIIGESRIPADVDIFTSRKPANVVREIAIELKEAGVERVSAVKGKQITIKGKKAIEVKELSLLEANIKKVQLPLQSVSSAFVKTPRGVRVLRLGSQVQRKVIGGFGLEAERRRLKDIEDLPSILRTLRQLKAERKASLSLISRRRLEPPSILPISLKREPPSILIGRRGEPSGLRGALPSISIIPSILRPRSREEPSILKPTKEVPSILKPIPKEDPSILIPPIREVPSIITPTPREEPSILRPPPKEEPSVLRPIEEVPEITKRIDLDREFIRTKRQILITQKAPSYDVQIRKGEKRGDKFITVEKRLPQNLALRRIKKILDNNIEASGRLKPSGKQPKQKDIPFRPDLSKFRPPKPGSKLPSNTIIEKKENRLDTLGEQQQISFFRRKKELKQRIARLKGLGPSNPKPNNPNSKAELLKSVTKGLQPDIPFRTELKLKLPKVTKIQKIILELVKKEGAAVTGSFAQKTFVKGSRGFKDIDIVTKDVGSFTRKLKKELKSKIRIKKVLIKSRQGRFTIARIFSRKTGKLIADIDPLKFAEGGIISKFGTQKVEGLKIVSVRARLQAKIMQLEEGKKRRKIAIDIRQLTASPLKTPTGFFSKGGIL